METQLDRVEARLTRVEEKLEATYSTAEKTRKYILWSGVIAIIVVVGPLLLLPLVIPSFLSTYSIPEGL